MNNEKEATAFSDFLSAAPTLGAQIESWCKPDDVAFDILSRSAGGSLIKWQLTEWLNCDQIQISKEHYKLKGAIESSLAESEFKEFSCYLSLKNPPVNFRNSDQEGFRKAFVELTHDVETVREMPPPPPRYTWARADQCVVCEPDLARWPVLARYLDHVEIAYSTQGKLSSFLRPSRLRKAFYT